MALSYTVWYAQVPPHTHTLFLEKNVNCSKDKYFLSLPLIAALESMGLYVYLYVQVPVVSKASYGSWAGVPDDL